MSAVYCVLCVRCALRAVCWVQLLGEIARGSWGVCRAEVPDLCKIGTEAQPVHVDWHELNTGDRLVYAAKSEMCVYRV